GPLHLLRRTIPTRSVIRRRRSVEYFLLFNDSGRLFVLVCALSASAAGHGGPRSAGGGGGAQGLKRPFTQEKQASTLGSLEAQFVIGLAVNHLADVVTQRAGDIGPRLRADTAKRLLRARVDLGLQILGQGPQRTD